MFWFASLFVEEPVSSVYPSTHTCAYKLHKLATRPLLQANPAAVNKQGRSVVQLCKTAEVRELIEKAIKDAEALKVGECASASIYALFKNVSPDMTWILTISRLIPDLSYLLMALTGDSQASKVMEQAVDGEGSGKRKDRGKIRGRGDEARSTMGDTPPILPSSGTTASVEVHGEEHNLSVGDKGEAQGCIEQSVESALKKSKAMVSFEDWPSVIL